MAMKLKSFVQKEKSFVTVPQICAHARGHGGCEMHLVGLCKFVHTRKELDKHPFYRTSKCTDPKCSDDVWCGKYHNERDRRTPPAALLGERVAYIPIMCSNKGKYGSTVCLKSRACGFCHTEEEFNALYKTRRCKLYWSETGCDRGDACGFFHDVSERRGCYAYDSDVSMSLESSCVSEDVNIEHDEDEVVQETERTAIDPEVWDADFTKAWWENKGVFQNNTGHFSFFQYETAFGLSTRCT